jgi:UDP-2-acetamido-3-amino-2,3-dideoxy-glucuronate N-acetyltransferase
MADAPANDAPYRLIDDVQFGEDVVVYSFSNLYGCSIGDGTRIGPFVEIQRGASIGARCKIQSHTFICDGVTIEDEVFVGHGVMFINDKYPRATTSDGTFQDASDWDLEVTRVRRGASLGSGAVILGGVTVGEGALVGAGAVVRRDVGGRSDRCRRAGAPSTPVAAEAPGPISVVRDIMRLASCCAASIMRSTEGSGSMCTRLCTALHGLYRLNGRV